MDDSWIDLLPAAVTLLAAFLGAWSAFQLDNKVRARRTTRAQVAAVNRGMFVLGRQYNLLLNLQAQVVDPVRDDPARFLNMRPFPSIERVPKFDDETLLFLLETPQREFMSHLMLAEDRFGSVLQVFQERSQLHVEQVQPRLEASKIAEKSTYTVDEIKQAIGMRLMLHLMRLTDDAIPRLDDTIREHEELLEQFRSAMVALFPDQKIIRVESLNSV